MLDNHQNEYVTRIHKVQDYIEENYGKNLSTEELAVVAGFSKYHFNRIFKCVMQEPLLHYVNRIRMEQAMFMLAHLENKNITDIAYELGFTDSAIFSRAFKSYYGLSPIAYRKKYSTNCKDSIYISTYNKSDKKKKWVTNPFPSTREIRIESVKECQVIYVRHTGTYCSLAKEYERLVRDLFRAASKQELLHPGKNQFLTLYHDNPEFGKEEQFRTSLCMTFPESCSVKEDGMLGVMTIDGGLYAVGYFEIVQEQFEDAWDYMYQKWLLTSKYVPRNAVPFEVYLNNPKEEKEHLIKVEIYMPIEPI